MAMTRILLRRRPRKWAGPTSSFSARPCREMGLTVDVHMRRARRADDDMMWRATLQTVWDDIPEDERARLDRGKWEAHFRRKIEPYMAGDRTNRGIAASADNDFPGNMTPGRSGSRTPETQGSTNVVGPAPNGEGKGGGNSSA